MSTPVDGCPRPVDDRRHRARSNALHSSGKSPNRAGGTPCALVRGMQLRWLSLLPVVIFTAACTVPVDAQSEDVDDDSHEHDSLFTSAEDANEPIPGLAEGVDPALDADVEELSEGEDASDDESVVSEPLILSGGTCVEGGSYCGGDKVTGDKKTLYRCNGKKTPTVLKVCSAGCSVNPGKDDSCAAAPAPVRSSRSLTGPISRAVFTRMRRTRFVTSSSPPGASPRRSAAPRRPPGRTPRTASRAGMPTRRRRISA